MTPDEFIERAVGIPWVRWRADWTAMDCFGLVVLYHREVLGLDPGAVPRSDISNGFSAAVGWVECSATPDATCFMAWRNGAPTHCGVLLSGGMVLHSEGSAENPGSVRITRLSAMQRAYGTIRFYKYEPHAC